MRLPRLISTAVMMLCLGNVIQAQTAPAASLATITVPEVEVRSGPSPEFYPTMKLRQGTPVKIVGEAKGDYLPIEPPKGSFSWICDRFILRNAGGTATVKENAEIRAGSSLPPADREPNAKTADLIPATLVIILRDPDGKISRPMDAKDGSRWWPIAPQIGKEVRYIPKDAVNVQQAVQNVTPPPDAGKPKDPTLLQAEQAEREGKTADAIKLYEQVANNPATPPDLRTLCQNRIQALRNGRMVSAPPGYTTGKPVTAVPASRTTVVPGIQRYPGRLRRAGFFIDGVQAYVLEDSQGRVQMYLTPQPGMDLVPFCNRNVILHGAPGYRGEIKHYFMIATRIEMLP